MLQDHLLAASAIAALRDLARCSSDGMLVLGGPQDRILHANPAICTALDRDEASLIGHPLREALPDLVAALPSLDALHQGGASVARGVVTLRPRRAAGAPPHPCALEVVPLHAPDGAVTGLVLHLRKPPWPGTTGGAAAPWWAAEAPPPESGPAAPAGPDDAAATLDALFEHIPEGLVLADAPDVRIRRVSAFALGEVGREAGSVLDRPAADHPQDWDVLHLDGVTPARPEELPLTRAVLAGETVQHESWILRRRDGSLLTILCSAGPIRGGPDGRITGGIVAWRDVTAMRRTEARLAESEARWRALAEAGALAVWTAAPDGALREVEAWCGLTGQAPAEAAAAGWLNAVHPDDRAMLRRRWEGAIARGAVLEAECRVRTRADGWRWVLLRAVPVRAAVAAPPAEGARPGSGEAGRILEWVGAAGDIHARKTAEEALRASQERFRTLAETMPHLVWQTDAAGVLDYVNRRMQQATRLRPGMGLAGAASGPREARRAGEAGPATVHPEDAPALAAAWDAALTEAGEFDLDARLRAEDGGWRWFRVQGAPVRDAATGRVRHWVGTCTDIDDRHRAAEERQAALEALEALARTAEHRIRNSLQLVAALLRLKASRMEAEPAAQAALLTAVARVQAVAEAHRALQKSPDMRSVRVADILTEIAAGASVAHPGSDLRIEADPALMLDADRAIPLTLVLNELASAAARDGAPALISARAAEAGALRVEVHGLSAWPPVVDAVGGAGELAETIVRALVRQIGATVEQPGGDVVAVVVPSGEAAAAEQR